MKRWRVPAAWAGLVAFIYAGVTVLVAVLHPIGKHDPKAVPIALFALFSALIGSAVIMRLQGRR